MTADWNDHELLGAIRTCSRCSDLPLGQRPILQWQSTAPILIAGQAPGRLTHAKGVPFDDPSGDRLRDWLGVSRTIFYDPEAFAIVPMAFCFPGTGKGGDLPPPPICAELWRHRLLGRMRNLQLTIIVGQFASAWHFPGKKATLTERVSCWREMLPQTIVLPHPSPRNRMWLTRNPWFVGDLIPQLQQRVKQVLTMSRGNI